MNIYDEALKDVYMFLDMYNFPMENIKKALERAKKVEELNELYKEKCRLLLNNVFVANPYINIDKRIIFLEKELEEMK